MEILMVIIVLSSARRRRRKRLRTLPPALTADYKSDIIEIKSKQVYGEPHI